MKILSFTCVRNEGPYLLEWIAYHRLIGVTDFQFFTNDCEDGSDLLLARLADHGVVRHIDQRVEPGKSVQWQALTHMGKERLSKGFDWAMFTDVDEFPMVHAGNHRLPDALAAMEGPDGGGAGPQVDAVAMPWRLFGASGKVGLVDRPVTEQFTRSAPPQLFHPIAGRYFKTLYRPDTFQKPGIHRPARKPKSALPRWRDGSGQALPDSFAEREAQIALPGLAVGRDVIELNHYSLRSAAAFLVKSARGLANRQVKRIDLSYWVERNFNTVVNPAMSVWSAKLAVEIARLRALPGIDDLHLRACDWHGHSFARLLRSHEGYRLYCDCLHAVDSAALPRDLAMELYGAYAAIPK